MMTKFKHFRYHRRKGTCVDEEGMREKLLSLSEQWLKITSKTFVTTGRKDGANVYEFYASTFLLKNRNEKSFQLSISFILIVMLLVFPPRRKALFDLGGVSDKI